MTVGVRSGDWIEYNVTYAGLPTQGHDVSWAHMEILGVQAPNIFVSITSRFSDGSIEATNYTLNLETGHLIDDFIIPANLNVGETFKDENLGNVTIEKAEQRTIAGATRTVLSASLGNNTYFWDQATGVSVEGASITSEYTIHTIASETNIWQPTQGSDLASLLLIAGALLIAATAVAAALMRYLRNRAYKRQQNVFRVFNIRLNG